MNFNNGIMQQKKLTKEEAIEKYYNNETKEQYLARISTGKQTISHDEYMNLRN